MNALGCYVRPRLGCCAAMAQRLAKWHAELDCHAAAVDSPLTVVAM